MEKRSLPTPSINFENFGDSDDDNGDENMNVVTNNPTYIPPTSKEP